MVVESTNNLIYKNFIFHLGGVGSSQASTLHTRGHWSYGKTATGSLPIEKWKDLRDHQVEKQDQNCSCGAAAAATLLRYYYGQEVYEKDTLDEIRRIGNTAERLRPYIKAVGLSFDFE